jgi:hypothetical protein
MEYNNNLLEIYKIEAEKYNKTREIHWKLNIAIWTVIIVAIYAQSENKLNFSNRSCAVKCLIYLIPFLIHCAFVCFIQGSLSRSLNRMNNAATILLDEKATKRNWDKLLDKTVADPNKYWHYLQLGITGFLLFIFYLTS